MLMKKKKMMNDCDEEEEDDEDQEEVITNTGRVYYKTPTRNQEMYPQQNIIRNKCGVTTSGRAKNIEESFKKFFTNEVLATIIEYTNTHMASNEKFY